MKSMRERFDEEFYSNPDTNGDLVIQWKIGDAENTKNTLMDFIEQELKKEREEIVEIVSKEFDRQSESCIQFGHEPILYLPDTKRIIINTIKNRYEQSTNRTK